MDESKPIGELNDETLVDLTKRLAGFFEAEFDEPLSEFRARQVIEYLSTRLGTKYYNMAIADAQAFLNDKLLDLDATLVKDEPEG